MDFSNFFDYPTTKDEKPTTENLFLQSFTPEDWEKFLSYTHIEKYSKGDYVIKSMEKDRSFFIVFKGSFDVLDEKNVKKPLLISRLGAGSVFGELGFLDGRPRSASVKAFSDGELVRLTYTSFESMAGKDLPLAYRFILDLAQTLGIRLRDMTRKLIIANSTGAP